MLNNISKKLLLIGVLTLIGCSSIEKNLALIILIREFLF